MKRVRLIWSMTKIVVKFLVTQETTIRSLHRTFRIETEWLWSCCPQSGLPERWKWTGVFLGIYYCYPACAWHFFRYTQCSFEFWIWIRLSKTDAPWSDTYKVVYQSDRQLTHPVSYKFTIGEENWRFEVTPKSGWENNTLIAEVGVIFAAIVILLSVLTRVWLVSKEHKNKFKNTGTHRFSYRYL